LLNLLALIGPEIDHAEAVLLAVKEVAELAGGGVPLSVSLGDRI
jgi:hypothetical protein